MEENVFLSAGIYPDFRGLCVIGLGNVEIPVHRRSGYGGAAFVLIYAAFLVLLGLPIIVMEYSVGRASQKSAALSFDVLEPKGTKWHLKNGSRWRATMS